MPFAMPGTPGYPGYGSGGRSYGGNLGETGMIVLVVLFGIMFICVTLLCCGLCCRREEPVPVYRNPLAALVGPTPTPAPQVGDNVV